jgi:hypothetical protein
MNKLPKVNIAPVELDSLQKLTKLYDAAATNAEDLISQIKLGGDAWQPVVDAVNNMLDKNEQLRTKYREQKQLTAGMVQFQKEEERILAEHAKIRDYIATKQEELLAAERESAKAENGKLSDIKEQTDELIKQSRLTTLRGIFGVPVNYIRTQEPQTAMGGNIGGPAKDRARIAQLQLKVQERIAGGIDIMSRRPATAW